MTVIINGEKQPPVPLFEEFTSTDTFTKRFGVKHIYVVIVGGGGGEGDFAVDQIGQVERDGPVAVLVDRGHLADG
ncbi:hypothetical protein LCGC14_2659700 [marine sediment metagenome]|uniref:Uncharacterized protein n=1 Tax=marine sediment metagenome TaxID=412755 RepID=A0A0F9C2I2_9ZZZZ